MGGSQTVTLGFGLLSEAVAGGFGWAGLAGLAGFLGFLGFLDLVWISALDLDFGFLDFGLDSGSA